MKKFDVVAAVILKNNKFFIAQRNRNKHMGLCWEFPGGKVEKNENFEQALKRERVDGYIIPKNDEFFSEYTPNHNDRLSYISNFTGSYGFSLILKNKNYLFVDGRYTLQAHNQCGKEFKIITFPQKMPSDILKNKKISIGFDPKLFTSKTLNIFF